MVVLMLEKASSSLRGEMSRWMIEPRAGVFVGKLSAMVRDKLWEKACASTEKGACMMVYPSTSEQGFTVRAFGDTSREVVDWEGLSLIRVSVKQPKARAPLDAADIFWDE